MARRSSRKPSCAPAHRPSNMLRRPINRSSMWCSNRTQEFGFASFDVFDSLCIEFPLAWPTCRGNEHYEAPQDMGPEVPFLDDVDSPEVLLAWQHPGGVRQIASLPRPAPVHDAARRRGNGTAACGARVAVRPDAAD